MYDLYKLKQEMELTPEQKGILDSWKTIDAKIGYDSTKANHGGVWDGMDIRKILSTSDLVMDAIRLNEKPSYRLGNRQIPVSMVIDVPGFDKYSLADLAKQGYNPTGEKYEGGPMFLHEETGIKTQLPYEKTHVP